MAVVRLKHITRKNDWSFYYYDGVVKVHKGVIELPAENFTRIRRAWLMGFRQTEDGQPILANRFQEIVAKATAEDSSEEPVNESPDSRGQPEPENGVRNSESDSSGNADEERPRSRVRSGSGKSRKRPTSTAGDEGEVPTS